MKITQTCLSLLLLLFSVVHAYGQCSPDLTSPTITCPASVSVDCPQSPILDNLAPTTYDYCGSVVLQRYTLTGATTGNSPSTGIHNVNSVSFLAGSTTVNYYIEDAAGNSATCSFNVTVNDFTPPVVSCPQNRSKTNDPGLCSAFVDLYELGTFPTAFDNCSGFSTIATGVPTGSEFPVGTTTVIWEITDRAGNTSTCPQNITVTDDEFPTIICPPNMTVNTDSGQCSANVTVPMAFADDNCTISSFVNSYNSGGANASGVYLIGTTTVTFTATDSSNKTITCSMDITVVNSQNPEITLNGNNPLTIEACGTYNELGATATDPCFGNLTGDIVINTSGLNTSIVGTYNVTYNVSNGNGNAATQLIRTVNVVDTTPPSLSLTGPNPLTIGDCSTYTELGAVAIDPCFGNISTNIVIDNTGVNMSVLGTYTVTYTVIDNHGNAATPITRTVHVVDISPPNIVLIGDNPQIIEACDSYTELGATAIEPCFNTDFSANLNIDTSSVDTSIVGTYFVTYNVVDNFGNIALEVIREVQVVNTIAPTITCPADIDVPNDLGECSAVVIFDTPLGVANCPVTVVQIAGFSSGSNFPIGTTTNTFEVTDPFGQTALCSFDVVVSDAENPIVICQNISVQLDPITGLAILTPLDIDDGSSDNCNVILSLSQTTFDCSNLGENIVTLTATDNFGNSSACDAIVTITDLAQNASVIISESVNPICENQSVTFTAIPTDGGAIPTYQWQINGIDVPGETAENFTTTSLVNGDDVSVLMTSNLSICAQAVLSNSITITVNDYNLPADAGSDITNTVCTSTTVTLAANAITGSGSAGLWTVTSGQVSGFSFSDPTSNTSTFTGDIGETYNLQWSIDNPSTCPDTSDSVTITFIGCNALDFDGIDDNITFRNNYNFSSDFSIEIWIKSETNSGDIQTIFSKREATNPIDGYDLRLVNNYVSFHWNDGQSLTGAFPIMTSRWHHIAVTFGSGIYTLYIDGIDVGTASGVLPLANVQDCIVGAMDETLTVPYKPLNYFRGGMDELRIWNVALTPTQIRKMMNQEIENVSGSIFGSTVPIDIEGLLWNDLDGYYRMNQNTDISDGDLLANGNAAVNGLLRYMTSLQPETAPLPYQTANDGLWTDPNSWLHGSVQATPNNMGIDGTTPIDWNIVTTNHNLDSGNNNLTLLGLHVNTNTLSIENSNPIDGQSLRITDYLRIDGVLDLVGESQLLQDFNSIVDISGTGVLERDQQGTSNLFNYNYWSSPVSSSGFDFTVGEVLYDGSTSSPQSINWTSSYNASGSINPITLSNRWIYTYEDTPGEDYFDWSFKGANNYIDVGLGFTLKGSGVGDPVTDLQNYVFVGKPNNGLITIPVSAPYQALVGNPYPSAIDAIQFIEDNGPSGTNSITGPLLFWEHSTTNNSHVLSEYEGGYATYSLSGGVQAVTAPSEIGGLGAANKIPERYIPIAQGFYVSSSATGGAIEFNNGQRVFVKESSGNSIFLRNSVNSSNSTSATNAIKRVRLNFKSPDGSIRPLLLAFTPNSEATEEIDYGYDAENTETFPNDASFIINTKKFVIQGTGSFDASKMYPLGLFLSDSGTVEIALTDLEHFETDIDVYIYDAIQNTSTQINDYHFSKVLVANDYLDRFYVTFEPKETLSDNELEVENIQVNYLNDSDEIYIKIPNSIEIRQLQLFNVLGQHINTWNITNIPNLNNELRLPVKDLSEGPYIIKVFTTASQIVSKKVIITY